MFRRTANFINAVADVLDEMLAADFEFEVDEPELVADGDLERMSLAGPTCATEGRYRRNGEPAGRPRRAGSVPRPVELCMTPLESASRRPDGGGTSRLS